MKDNISCACDWIHLRVAVVENNSGVLFTVALIVGNIKTNNGRDYQIVALCMAIGILMMRIFVQGRYPHDLIHDLEHIRRELGSVTLNNSSRDSVLEINSS